MGIITTIEEKLGDIVEKPFSMGGRFDPLSLEITVKRCIEGKKKLILGHTYVPNYFDIVLEAKTFREYEPFLDKLEMALRKSLIRWLDEKKYEIVAELVFDLKEGKSGKKAFQVCGSFRKSESDGGSTRTESNSKAVDGNSGVVVGELIHEGTGKRFPIPASGVLIGRGDECRVRLSDPTVSDRHAQLSVQYGKVVLKDLESRNGSRVNCKKVGCRVLIDGDRIQFGETKFTFAAGGDSIAQTS